MKPTVAEPPGERVNVAGATSKTEPWPVARIVVRSGADLAPCTAPISVMPGLPSSEHAVVDVFDTLTGLKIEPAAPVPSSATTFSWLAVQGAIVAGWVEVVVVEEVLVVEVVGASVVEVDVVAGVAVVVTGVAAWEQPATRTAKPRTIRE